MPLQSSAALCLLPSQQHLGPDARASRALVGGKGHEAATSGNVGIALPRLVCKQNSCMHAGEGPQDLLHQLWTLASIRRPWRDRPLLRGRGNWPGTQRSPEGLWPRRGKGPHAVQILAGLGAHSG